MVVKIGDIYHGRIHLNNHPTKQTKYYATQ